MIFSRSFSLRTKLILASVAVEVVMLSLLVFVGEAVRDAFDPRKALGAK
mgnify:CR=1 FL=1